MTRFRLGRLREWKVWIWFFIPVCSIMAFLLLYRHFHNEIRSTWFYIAASVHRAGRDYSPYPPRIRFSLPLRRKSPTRDHPGFWENFLASLWIEGATKAQKRHFYSTVFIRSLWKTQWGPGFSGGERQCQKTWGGVRQYS